MPLLALETRRITREVAGALDSTEADRVWKWRLRRLFASWCGCYILGTGVVLSSFGVQGQALGDILFWLGLCIGNVGGLLVLMLFAVFATERGDL